MNISDLRSDYPEREFDPEHIDPNPMVQFREWLAAAIEVGHLEPNSMTVATSTPDGKPSARMVLLKGLDERGFIFYTNFESRKGIEIAQNPYAALVFYWDIQNRQVRIEGTVEVVESAEADTYYASRPRGSRIGAWASRQSEVLSSREILEARIAELEAQYPNNDIPRPPYWGGYRVVPTRIEFWQGRPSRLHDRLVYTLEADATWSITRLAP